MAALSKRDKLEDLTVPMSRIGREIESLRQRIADLESLESELSKAEQALSAGHADETPATSDEIKNQIKRRLGYFPPPFVPAADYPDVLWSLWQQSLAGYYDNPLPELLKEKLFAQLARYCAAPYSIVTHSCNLHRLGIPAADVLQLLEHPAPSPEEDLERVVRILSEAPHPLVGWPDPDSELHEALVSACILFFLKPAETERCHLELRHLLTSTSYEHLAGFLAYVKAFHLWLEAHAEISYHSDPQVRAHIPVLLRDEPRLAALFGTIIEISALTAAGWRPRKRCAQARSAIKSCSKTPTTWCTPWTSKAISLRSTRLPRGSRATLERRRCK